MYNAAYKLPHKIIYLQKSKLCKQNKIYIEKYSLNVLLLVLHYFIGQFSLMH